MNWSAVATQLFGPDHDIQADGDFLSGSARRRWCWTPWPGTPAGPSSC
jgi:hypothetical protein